MDQLETRFDLVHTRYPLHHFSVPPRFLEKARSVLCPGGMLLIADWIEGARTGVPEWTFAPQTVVAWARRAGFDLLHEEVRGQSKVVVGKLPSAEVEAGGTRTEER